MSIRWRMAAAGTPIIPWCAAEVSERHALMYLVEFQKVI